MQILRLEHTIFRDIRRRPFELNPELDGQTLADTLEGATNHDRLWEEVNALGGIPAAGSEYDRGYCDAISRVLWIIEGERAPRPLTDAGEI